MKNMSKTLWWGYQPSVRREVSGALHNLAEGVHVDDGAAPARRHLAEQVTG